MAEKTVIATAFSASKSATRLDTHGAEKLNRRLGRFCGPHGCGPQFGSRVGLCFFRSKGLPVRLAEQSTHITEFSGALQPFSAVHHDHFAVDLRAAIAYEKRSEIRKLLEGAKAPGRNAAQRILLEILPWQETREGTFGADGTRGDGIQANAARTPLDREAPGKRQNACFRHGGGHHIGGATSNCGVSGRNVQHRRVLPGLEPTAPTGYR